MSKPVFGQFDPLGLYKKKPGESDIASNPVADRPAIPKDVVDVVLGEAKGGDTLDMMHVASAIANRSRLHGVPLEQVVRNKTEFNAYGKPLPDGVEAYRADAEAAIARVLADGPVTDATFYATPDAAGNLPKGLKQVASTDGHQYFTDPQGRAVGTETGYKPRVRESGQGGDKNASGLARLAPPEPDAQPTGAAGQLSFRHEGQDKLDPAFLALLTDTSADIGRPLEITSGLRTAKHPVEAAKIARGGKPGEHSTGTASDISMAGMSPDERATLMVKLRERGAERFGVYKNMPDMLHVDMKKMPRDDARGMGGNSPWFMYDKTADKVAAAPDWFKSAIQVVEKVKPGRAAGKAIAAGGMELKDPLGLYSGKDNPFAVAPVSKMPDQGPILEDNPLKPAPATAGPVEPPAPIPAPDPDPNPDFVTLDAENPGRYKEMNLAEYTAWKAEWDKANKSGGIGGDIIGLAKAGTASGVLAIREGTRQFLNMIDVGGRVADAAGVKLPRAGDIVVGALDKIDQWATGNTSEQILEGGRDRAVAGLTAEQQAARQKEWVSETKNEDGSTSYRLGPAWADPRSYMGGAVESLPATAITMAPGGIMARSAYISALGRGVGQKAAAATAAKTATVAGAVLEGAQGGGSTAMQVREQIAALPRETLLASDAVKSLISGGMTEDQAVSAVTEDAATQAFIVSGVITGAFGGLGDRALAKIVGEGVSGGIKRRMATGAVKGAVAEGLLEEAPQSAGEQIAANKAMQTIDPDQSLTEGVPNAVAGGAVAGGLMGTGFGAAGGAASKQAPGMAQEPPAEAAAKPQGQTATVNDPSFTAKNGEVFPAGPNHGQSVTILPGQDELAGSLVRVRLQDGTTQLIGRNLLTVAPSDPKGPIGRGLKHQVEQDAQRNQADPVAAEPVAAQTDPAAPVTEPVAVPVAGQPTPAPSFTSGQMVRISAPGGDVIEGRFDSIVDDGEALIFDANGEIFQVPLADLQAVDDPAPAAEAVEPAPAAAAAVGMSPAPADAAPQDSATPPAAPVEQPAGPLTRRVAGRTATFADETQAKLYDLGERLQIGRNSSLPMNHVMEALADKQKEVADLLSVPVEKVNEIADDFRYRVTKAARKAAADFVSPVVDAKRLNAARNPAAVAAAPVTAEAAPAAQAVTDEQIDRPVAELAHEAATSPLNDLPQPTEAQKEAGNYKKGHVNLAGFDISIENPQGSTRSGADRSGKAWSVEMKSHYGYFKGTIGPDKDHIDTFISPVGASAAQSLPVFVVNQIDPETGKFDEPKVMLGYPGRAAAEAAYRENYAKDWNGIGDIVETDTAALKEWFATGNTQKPFPAAAKTGPAAYSKADLREVAKTALPQMLRRHGLIDKIKTAISNNATDDEIAGIVSSAAITAGGSFTDDSDYKLESGRLTISSNTDAERAAFDGWNSGGKIGPRPASAQIKMAGKHLAKLLRETFPAEPQAETKAEPKADSADVPANSPAPVEKPREPKPSPTIEAFVPAEFLDPAVKKHVASLRDTDAGDMIAQIDALARRAAADMNKNGMTNERFQADDLDPAEPGYMGAWAVLEALDWITRISDEAKAAKGMQSDALDELLADAYDYLETFEGYGFGAGTVGDSPVDWRSDRETPPMPEDKVFPPTEKTVAADKLANTAGQIPLDEAESRLAEWKAEAKRIGKTGANAHKMVISMFDYTGAWAQPWRDAGYQVLQFDIKSGTDVLVDEYVWNQVEEARQSGIEVVGVLSACPCTTFAGSGARWWADLHDVKSVDAVRKVFGDPAVLAGAKSPREYNVWLVDATRDMVSKAAPTRFHALENPIGRIETVAALPAPRMRFHPHTYGDPYTKRTQLFGDFNTDLPTANVDPVDGSKMQSKFRGDDPLGKESRSETPEGFAYAFFMANEPLAVRAAAVTAPAAAKAESKPSKPAADAGRRSKIARNFAGATYWNSKDLGVERLDLGEKPGERAAEIIKEWAKDGAVERSIILDRNGDPISYMEGSASNTGMSSLWDDASGDPSEQLVVHHNHPRGFGFSNSDLHILSAPGMRVGYAFTPTGEFYRAAMTSPRVRAYFEADNKARGQAYFQSRLIEDLVAEWAPEVWKHIRTNAIDRDDANRQDGRIRAMMLRDGGVIDYFENDERPLTLLDLPPLKEKYDEIVNSISRRIAALPGDDRPAGAIRFAGDMESLPERAFLPAAKPGQESPHADGGRTDPADKPDGDKRPSRVSAVPSAKDAEAPRNFAVGDLVMAAGQPVKSGSAPTQATKTEKPAVSSTEQFAGNKIFTADKVEAARARLRAKMGQINSGIDPELLIDGMTLAGAYIESGTRKFADYAARMIADLGDGIRPYLLSFYDAARSYPGLDTAGMSSHDEAAAEHAALMAPGVPQSEKVAVGEIVPAPKKRKPRTDAGEDMVLTDDWGVSSIDGYEAKDERPFGPTKDAFLKEAIKYLKAVAEPLAERGFSGVPNRKGQAMAPVSRNDGGAAVSGDATLHMVHQESGAHVYVNISGGALRGVVPTTKSGVQVMARAGLSNYGTDGVNQWQQTTLTAGELSAMLLKMADRVSVAQKPAELPDEPAKLDQRGESALAGAPAGEIQGGSGSPDAEQVAAKGGGTDLFGDIGTGGRRNPAGRSLADGARALSDPASGSGRTAETGTGAANPARSEPDAAERKPAELAPDLLSLPHVAQNHPADFAITDADAIGEGGAKTKFRGNIAAIRILRTLDEEKRAATREEQSALAKWVGWGGMPQAFPRSDGSFANGWKSEADELRDILTDAEYEAAAASTRNAHFTSPEVVRAIWSAVGRLGFQGGKVLEPSVGSGNFLGLMPGKWRQSAHVTGVELDNITGGIAKNLYPKAAIRAPLGFQALTVPDNYFDLAIGNPPFGSERLYDAERRHLNRFSIHNYFFAKSLDTLRPGGVLAMVVSNFLLDAQTDSARRYLAERADLLGAIRLPNNAFLKNAGTEVTTDIIFLQKRAEQLSFDDRNAPAWVNVGETTGADGNTVPLNRYFIKNPEMMLGDFGLYGTMYAEKSPALIQRDGDDIPTLLDAAIATLPDSVMPEPSREPVKVAEVAPGNVRDALVNSVFISSDDSIIYQRLPDHIGEARATKATFASTAAEARVRGMIQIRDAFTILRGAQVNPKTTDAALGEMRATMNAAYDAFVKDNGPINADSNKRLMRDDPSWPQLAALENGFDKGISATIAAKTGEQARAPSAKKADIFFKRTQQPYTRPTSAATAEHALEISLSDRAGVDLPFMVALTGKTEAALIEELGSLIYQVPGGPYVTADEYLSGNVKKKLAEAEAATLDNPDLRRNVRALIDVQPADVEAVDIDVKPGAPWIPPKHIEDFVTAITEGDKRDAKAHYSRTEAVWKITAPRPSPSASVQYGTDYVAVSQVITAAINGKQLTVYHHNADGTKSVNAEDTAAANEKVERVKAEWSRWLWTDEERRLELTRIYNDTFNTDVVRQFNGSHLKLPGKVSDDIISLHPHQKNWVWRSLQSETGLADHTVGAGKTFAAIAGVMERRRTGRARKPMMVVPNHLVGQWAADFVKLYPGAKILATTKADFEKENRLRLFVRMATGDYDAIIVAHSQFKYLAVTPAFEASIIREQIADLVEAEKEAVREEGGKARSVKQMEKKRQSLESRVQKLMDSGRKDIGLTMEEIGIDDITIDEAHEFKNLPFATGMQRIAGLGNPGGSQKAMDLYIKMRLVKARGGRRFFLTGTPISNTMAEMFTMQRYLAEDELRHRNIHVFDAWAKVFGMVVSDWEISVTGKHKMNSRFAKFVNVPELISAYRSFADVVNNDDIKEMLAKVGKTLALPKVKGGKPLNVIVEPSAAQLSYIDTLIYRAEHLPKGKLEKGADNMLKVMSDARKAALDMRLIDPAIDDFRESKIHDAADRMLDIYRKWDAKKGTQLVFIDLSTPKAAAAKQRALFEDMEKRAAEGDEDAQEALDKMSPDEILALESSFSVYDDLKAKLIRRGIPADEIAFIHDANTDIQKEELFGKVRSGRIRFLFGSTAKMGAGTNVQKRLVALHHMDAPWRPSDLEQREGRIIRQGNDFYMEDPDGFEVEINRYATERTLDARMWQIIEAKANFISQVRKGTSKDRTIEDVGGQAMSAAEMKAAASGNPLIFEEMELRSRVRKLEMASSEHDRDQHRLADRMRDMAHSKDKFIAKLPGVEVDAVAAAKVELKEGLEVAGKFLEKSHEVGEEIIQQLLAYEKGVEPGSKVIANIGDFALTMKRTKYFVSLGVQGREYYEIGLESDILTISAAGMAARVRNVFGRIAGEPARIKRELADIEKQTPGLERQIRSFEKAQDLVDARARHKAVIELLKPKIEIKPPQTPAEGDKPVPADAELSATPTGWGAVEASNEPVFTEADAAAVEKIIKDVAGLESVTYADRIAIPANVDGWGPTSGTAGGFYSPALDAITIARQINARHIAYHEAFHRLQRHFLTDKEKAVLASEAPRLRAIIRTKPFRAAQVKHMSQKELEAEAFAMWAKKGGGATMPHRGFRAGWERLATALRRVANYLRGRGFTVAEDIFAAAKSGSIKDRGGPVLNNKNAMQNPAFKRWFGKSKIVEGDGSPRVVYHGTSRAIDQFKPGQDNLSLDGFAKNLGMYFTPDPKVASGFSRMNKSDGSGPTIYPVYLRVENPLVIKAPTLLETAAAKISGAKAARQLHRDKATQSALITERRLAELKDQGYDGIINKETNEIVVFDPEQVKSVYNGGKFDANDPRIQYSANPADSSPDESRIIQEIRGKLADLTPSTLAAIPLNYFTELARPNMIAVKEYLRVKRLMDAYRGHRHAMADEKAQQWLKYAKLGLMGKDRAAAAALADLMHDATIAGVDPAADNADLGDLAYLLDDGTKDWETVERQYAGLRGRFEKLSKEGQDLFTSVRDSYKEQQKELDALLIENVKKAQHIAEKHAEAKYLAEMDRIEKTPGMQPDAIRDAKIDATKAYKTERAKSTWSMSARLTRLRKFFESSKVKPPYFPLGRFGDYGVTVKGQDGSVLSFSKRETNAAAVRLAADLRAEYPHATVKVSRMGEKTSNRDNIDPRTIAEVEDILSGLNVDPTNKEAIYDQIWQRYLDGLPDLSIRKKFIHRKGTAGFEQDALRTFSHHMFHAAHQMAKLKYGLELGELKNDIVVQGKDSDDPVAGVALANEMQKRHEWVMKPTGGKLAQAVTSAAFVWYLAATPAAAMVNLTQTPMLGIPMLAARFGSFTAAAKAMGKASADVIRGGGAQRNMRLTASEREAIEAFYESGLIDRTQSHDLAGVGDTGVSYTPLRSKVMAGISWLFHKAEVWNREVTALAAFRMARDAKPDVTWTEAVDVAHDLTWRTHFDYANSSRPRMMQNDFAKVALVFRSHNINMLYRLARDTKQAFAGETPQARREARFQLTGILSMMALMSGITGVAGFNLIMGIMGAVFGDDDDPIDFQTRFRADVIKAVGPELGGVLLDGAPGHYLGVSLTSRIGMPDLWFRSPPGDLKGRDEYEFWVMNSLGAAVSTGGKTVYGYQMIRDDNVARGIEAMAPKAVADLMKAYRYAYEGVTDSRGNVVLPADELSGLDLFKQAAGFTPAIVEETWDRNRALKNAEQRLNDKRQTVINAFALALSGGNDDEIDEAIAAIQKFNAVPAHAPVAISNDTLKRSIRTRARNAAQRIDGALISNRALAAGLANELPAPVYRD